MNAGILFSTSGSEGTFMFSNIAVRPEISSELIIVLGSGSECTARGRERRRLQDRNMEKESSTYYLIFEIKTYSYLRLKT